MIASSFARSHSLTTEEIDRYSRQLILPELGVSGQDLLKKAKVVLVGAGGLGCPSAVYLAAAGIGTIGVIDYDRVEQSNLHRQVLHTMGKIGDFKAESIVKSIADINPLVNGVAHNVQLSSSNAMALLSQYDVVLDCTDNVPTRYLLNDACVLLRKPLVSGSALRWEGQLTVFDSTAEGPCYRCLYPTPPPPETVTNCSEGGVMGAVTGVIGSLQALETIKIVTGLHSTLIQKLLLFDGLTGTTRTIALRKRQTNCAVCGDKPTVTQLCDYEKFCGMSACDKVITRKILSGSERITVGQLKEFRLATPTNYLLIDTRPTLEFDIGHLPEAQNIPIDSLISSSTSSDQLKKITTAMDTTGKSHLFVICHRGNDSQLFVERLKLLIEVDKTCRKFEIKDVIGGLEAWTNEIDQTFPRY